MKNVMITIAMAILAMGNISFSQIIPAVHEPGSVAPPAVCWVLGYYTSAPWGSRSLSPQDLPWAKYTHMGNCGAQVAYDNSKGQWTLDLHAESIDQTSTTFVQKAHENNVKALLLVGGSGTNFANATSSANITAFVNNIVSVINTYGYDGVDIDWETSLLPAQFADLLSRLRSALGSGVLITIDTGDWDNLVEGAAQAQSYLNMINVMTYDMDRGASLSWYCSALYNDAPSGFGGINSRMRSLVNAGIPKSKLTVGIAFYGRLWTGVTQPLQSGGTMHTDVAYGSLVSDATRWQDGYKNWDKTHYAEYLSISNLNAFISYTGPHEIREIVQWAKQQGFAGFMTWDINEEYVSTQSNDARFPLSTALRDSVIDQYTPASVSPQSAKGAKRSSISP